MEKRAIYKYKIGAIGETTFVFPFHTEVLHFECINGEFFIWVTAILKTKYEIQDVEHIYQIVGTGWEFTENWYHQGTTIEEGYVWHLLLKD